METKGDSLQALVAKHKAKAQLKELEKLEESKGEGATAAQVDGEVEEESNIMTTMTFEELGVCPEICEAIKAMGYKHPSKI